MELKDFFKENEEVALAFSGGVDSCYLLFEALKYAKRVTPYFVLNSLQSEYEKNDAIKIANKMGVNLKVINIDALSDKRVRDNSEKRCYYCKRMIFEEILNAAKADGYSIVIEGTNASDDVSDRPGVKALMELEIKSPLRECGITKACVRKSLKDNGFSFWDKPSSACLATRIPYYNELSRENLLRVEKAEEVMRNLGFSDFRVREVALRDESLKVARIQVREEQFSLVFEKRSEIKEGLGAIYDNIFCDLEER